ncbi:hypothetical protein T05_12452 [Trichinella murrelli]|uniref:Uncharacterized protein n=1 Tax=Trichinella murrelli TaxID=144512 RepID=A0A0V0TXA9_9BILA|nr:hypothetical protein T05_12452 [Trichinella murrelli]
MAYICSTNYLSEIFFNFRYNAFYYDGIVCDGDLFVTLQKKQEIEGDYILVRLDPHIILLKRKKGSHFLVIFTNCQMKFVCLCSVFFENCVQFSKNIFYKPLEQKRRKFNATAFKSHRIEHTDLIIKKY